ncbi:MAG: Ni/Fe-hydrogenase cytochrome b subunit [Gemmatimonadales bacterium]|nr:Ni/Fe-hydrogenase cytochrome b subunit [Gemmatimonadales bacterium]
MNNPINGSSAGALPLNAPEATGHGDHEVCLPLAEQGRVPFITPGVMVLMGFAAIGLLVLAARFIFGIGAVTNLDNQYPWGLWIGIDVATGVALAAGGFTTAFIAHVLHQNRYHEIVRPALLTAMLGYTFVALGVVVDLGRYYNIWHVLVPKYWQGNSALFEVGMCVCIYLTVLYIEFLPIVCERFIGRINLPGPLGALNGPLDKILRLADAALNKTITFFIIMGVVLSCAHQSSLGTLMVIAPTKLHALWYTPILPLQFLLSAFAVGLAMAIFESLIASRSFKRPFEMSVLSPLGRMIPFLLTIYFAAKLIDLVNRGVLPLALEPTLQAATFWIEIIGGVLLPIFIFLIHGLRRRPGWLFAAAAMVVLGVALNRVNVFIIGYKPLFGDGPYVPAIPEVLLTIGFISILTLVYRAWVFIFPILPVEGGHDNA